MPSQALPSIVRHFHSPADVGWYASAYLITSCACLPLFGRLYTIADLKWTYVASLIIFIAGSTLCALAPSSVALIVGRAVAGLGSAGMFPGTLIIGSKIVKPERRVLLMAIGGLTMSLASILGPMIGGQLVEAKSWRWCFVSTSSFLIAIDETTTNVPAR
jgi:MFS family permease